MKLCVLGNSHLASLKLAWDQIADQQSDFELTFFGSPRMGMNALRAEPEAKKLFTPKEGVADHLAQSSGGLREIDYTKYDAFLLYGLFFGAPRLDKRHSDAVKQATINDMIQSSLALQTARKLGKLGEKHVFFGLEPLLSDGGEKLIEAGNLEPNLLEYRDITEHIARRLKRPYWHLLSQPEETIDRLLTTNPEYGKGSVRLLPHAKKGSVHPARDVHHMNAEYGKLYLERALPQIATVVKAQSAA